MADTHELKAFVREAAGQCGFARLAVAPAGPVPTADQWRGWLAGGNAAGMEYLHRNVDIRLDPRRLLDGARSVLCLATSYAPASSHPPLPPGAAAVSRYARARDYHKVLKKRARTLCAMLEQQEPSFRGRVFVDGGPVAERALAAWSGLGWIGRSGMLIVPGLGNQVFLTEVVTNLDIPPDEPRPTGCGDCRACISACPTGAILGDGFLDARRCLSYHSIENRGPISPDLWDRFGACLFGCDRCQVVCPHNKFAAEGDEELRSPDHWTPPQIADVLAWEQDAWDRFTRGSASRRAKLDLFQRNAVLAAGNVCPPQAVAPLDALRANRPDLADEIDWALERIRATAD